MKYCQKCGNQINDNSMFCAHCGGEQKNGNHSSPQNENTVSSSLPAFFAKYSKGTWIRIAITTVLVVVGLIKVPAVKTIPSFVGSLTLSVIIAKIYASQKEDASKQDVFKVFKNCFLVFFIFVLMVDAFMH